MRNRAWKRIGWFLLVFAGLPADALLACPRCVDAVGSAGDDPLITGFRYSILILLACPLLMVSFVGWRIHRARRHRVEKP